MTGMHSWQNSHLPHNAPGLFQSLPMATIYSENKNLHQKKITNSTIYLAKQYTWFNSWEWFIKYYRVFDTRIELVAMGRENDLHYSADSQIGQTQCKQVTANIIISVTVLPSFSLATSNPKISIISSITVLSPRCTLSFCYFPYFNNTKTCAIIFVPVLSIWAFSVLTILWFPLLPVTLKLS